MRLNTLLGFLTVIGALEPCMSDRADMCKTIRAWTVQVSWARKEVCQSSISAWERDTTERRGLPAVDSPRCSESDRVGHSKPKHSVCQSRGRRKKKKPEEYVMVHAKNTRDNIFGSRHKNRPSPSLEIYLVTGWENVFEVPAGKGEKQK